jgi:RNA polymerase sigma factor (TIGR02999 family)
VLPIELSYGIKVSDRIDALQALRREARSRKARFYLLMVAPGALRAPRAGHSPSRTTAPSVETSAAIKTPPGQPESRLCQNGKVADQPAQRNVTDNDRVDTITAAVTRAESGDAAAKDALFAALYDELHRLAQSHLRRSGGELTISATTLLHDAYLELAGRGAVAFPDENRFLGYASRAMRGLVIDYVRRRSARKRGGELTFTSLQDHHVPHEDGSVDLERLGRALEELASVDPALSQLVDLKFFCGFSLAEIATMRNVSERTVQRDWAKARAVLHQSLHDE